MIMQIVVQSFASGLRHEAVYGGCHEVRRQQHPSMVETSSDYSNSAAPKSSYKPRSVVYRSDCESNDGLHNSLLS